MSSLLEKYRNRKETIKSTLENIWATLENGENYLRFIPNPSDGGFYTQAYKHDNLELLGLEKPTLLCGKSFGGDRCAICDLLKELSSEKDASTLDILKKCSAKIRCFSYVYVLKSPSDTAPQSGCPSPKILSFGAKIEEALLSIYLDPDYGDFTNLDTGRTITIVKSGQGRSTSYSVLPKPKSSAFKCNISDLKPIEVVIPPRTYEEVQKYISGEISSFDEKPTEKQIPASKKEAEQSKSKENKKPDCLNDGETFSPKSSSCKTCSYFEECKETFLKM